jgi:hypothetical protein
MSLDDEKKKVVMEMLNKIVFSQEELKQVMNNHELLQNNLLKFMTTIVWSDINFHLNELTDITCDDELNGDEIIKIIINYYNEYIIKYQ